MMTNRDYVWRHLSGLPTFRSLIRSIEDRLIDAHKPFVTPILDVGVGDGHFANAALGPCLDVGIDLSMTWLREAEQYGIYRLLLRASATEMPLPSNHFATVISNCVIEHIPDLRSTLGEMHRTLRPGGTLILTVPTDQFERNFLIPRVLRAFGLDSLASSYQDWFRRKQVHYHLLSPDEWVATLGEMGFEVVVRRGYMSRVATAYFELLHYAGWHNLIKRSLLGRWVIWPWRPRFALMERLLARFVDEPEHADDSDLFMVARKVESVK